MRPLTRFTIATLAIALPVDVAHAATIRVPGDAPTILAAILIAGEGDEILVAPGTYFENIAFPVNTASLTLRSEAGPARTIIDGQGRGRIFTLDHVIGIIAVEGFTLRNGRDYSYGGAVYVNASLIYLRNNVITRNQQTEVGGAGGGIFFSRFCSPANLVEGNLIADNTASNGSGIYTFAAVQIRSNTIVGNTSPNGGGGGGIRSWGATIERNIVVANHASAGIYCDTPSMLVCNDVWGNDGGDYFGCTPGSGISADPLFCNPSIGDYSLDERSPCLPASSPPGCGLIGAYDVGCGPIAVGPTTWGRIKATY